MSKAHFDMATSDTTDAYKLLTGLVVPRPIGWIGTRRHNGSFNLAPFSFFNVVSSNPPTVLFSGGRHPDRPKDSVVLAAESGEFTVNIVSEEVAPAMNETSGTFPPEVDEFEVAKLTAVQGRHVSAPMVAEAPANLECRVGQVIDLGPEGNTMLVIGDVLALHVEERVLDGTRILSHELKAVGRMAGNTYVSTDSVFDLTRSSDSRRPPPFRA